MNLEKYVSKKVQFDIVPYDSPLYGLSEKDLGDLPFHNKSTLTGVIERNTGIRSHYALRLENGESVALVDEQYKWIFNLKEIKNDA